MLELCNMLPSIQSIPQESLWVFSVPLSEIEHRLIVSSDQSQRLHSRPCQYMTAGFHCLIPSVSCFAFACICRACDHLWPHDFVRSQLLEDANIRRTGCFRMTQDDWCFVLRPLKPSGHDGRCPLGLLFGNGFLCAAEINWQRHPPENDVEQLASTVRSLQTLQWTTWMTLDSCFSADSVAPNRHATLFLIFPASSWFIKCLERSSYWSWGQRTVWHAPADGGCELHKFLCVARHGALSS